MGWLRRRRAGRAVVPVSAPVAAATPLVRLAFTDGSAVTLPPDDPRVRVFRALADEIARGAEAPSHMRGGAPRRSRQAPNPPMRS